MGDASDAATMDLPRDILETLDRCHQSHLVQFWGELNPRQRLDLAAQLQALDFEQIARLAKGSGGEEQAASPRARAARAEPPDDLVRLPAHGGDAAQWLRAADLGEELLRAGRVGAILVAGGQGTRLGFDRPKGMFEIGPVSGKSLFQFHCEQLLARSRRAGRPIPYFVMTSDATHVETVAFFEEHARFGLPREDVYFFQQGSLPALAADSLRILLDEKHRIATSPDGHGGIVRALAKSGMLDVMRERGIDVLYYHQVDSPTAIVCDPAFLGWHAGRDADVSTKVVAKESAEERMGVVVSLEGRTEIIEYSDLPDELAGATEPDGQLRLWAGNTAMHVFSRSFLESLVGEGRMLPFHRAHKAVAHLNESGERVQPADPSAYKFEQFIFDALPLAKTALVVEADRAREFNPVKNATGKDSPETARAGLLAVHRSWLDAAGARVGPGVRVEISPLFALDAGELRERLGPAARFDDDQCVEG